MIANQITPTWAAEADNHSLAVSMSRTVIKTQFRIFPLVPVTDGQYYIEPGH